jgi:hypothetical protein
MKFKYQDQKLKFAIKIVNQDNEEWHFNDKGRGRTNREEQITVLEQLIKQMRGELMSEDIEWQSFDENFYRLLKKHSGLEFNADSKTFEWFCKERDKLWSQIKQMENENV